MDTIQKHKMMMTLEEANFNLEMSFRRLASKAYRGPRARITRRLYGYCRQPPLTIIAEEREVPVVHARRQDSQITFAANQYKVLPLLLKNKKLLTIT
jgi:hypothetical protein